MQQTVLDPKETKQARGLRVGYVRVSSVDQKTTRQLDGVSVDRLFSDQVSGRTIERPQLREMLLFVREGDTVLVHSMDRLARNVDDLRALVAQLTKRRVKVQFMKENLTFSGEDSPMANLLLSVLGAVAQFERDLIRERQREGIAIAKERGGVFKGRKRKFTATEASEVAKRLDQGESPTALGMEYGVNRQTIYRARKAAER